MDILLTARRLAMAAVLERDRDYQLRYIFRWYSKTFSTPLHQVEELPLQDVLQAWYETQYDALVADDAREEDLQNEMVELTETDEEAAARQMTESREQDEAEQFAKEIEEEERQKAVREAAPPPLKKKATQQLIDAVTPERPAGPSMPEIPTAPSRPIPQLPRSIKSETELPRAPMSGELPPDVHISFVEPEEFERILEEEQSLKGPK